MEDPLYTNCLTPDSLVMRRCACFYCGGQHDHDVSIYHTFGLRHCALHAGWAQRDCNAWLHEQGMVRLSDVKNDTAFEDLMGILEKGIAVKRSNGNIDSGWIVNWGSPWDDPVYVRRFKDGQWGIQMKSGRMDIQKYVMLSKLLEENPSEAMAQAITRAEQRLIDGVYKADYAAHCEALLSGTPTKIEETDGIVQGMLSSGQMVRVLPPAT